MGHLLVAWPVVLFLPNKYEAMRGLRRPSTALKPVIQGIAIEQDVNSELQFREAVTSESRSSAEDR